MLSAVCYLMLQSLLHWMFIVLLALILGFMYQVCCPLVKHGSLIILLSILSLQFFSLSTCLITGTHWILDRHGVDAKWGKAGMSDSMLSPTSPGDGAQATAGWTFFCAECGSLGAGRSCSMARARGQQTWHLWIVIYLHSTALIYDFIRKLTFKPNCLV